MTTDDTPARIYLCHNRNGHPRFEEVGPDDLGAEAWVKEGAGIRVKALEWEHGPETRSVYAWWKSDKYRIDDMKDRGFRAYSHAWDFCVVRETIEAAKAAAQADYETRIRAALEPVAQPETPTPGQFETMCLAIEDVVTGRGFDVDPWQPIETAPKDGTKFLAFWPETDVAAGDDTMTTTWWNVNSGGIGCWETAWSSADGDEQPMYWRPTAKPGETTSAIPETVKAYLRNALTVGGWRGERG